METIKLKYDSNHYINTNQIEIGALHIANSESDLIDSLFEGFACQWICKRYKRYVQFFTTAGDKSLVATLNKYGVLCSYSDNQYSLGCIDSLPTHVDREYISEEILNRYAISRDRLGYIYN